MNLSLRKPILLIPVALTLLFIGCDSTNSSGDQAALQISFVATNGATMPKTSTMQSSHVALTEVKLLVREIEFESDLEDDGVAEDSLEFETGPLVISLNLDSSVTPVAVHDVKAGTYDEIEFKLHKPEDTETPPDPDFKIGTSGDERFSIIVRGTYYGQDFLFRSTQNMEQEIELPEPLVLEEDRQVNVTLNVDLSTWFVDQQGNDIDPTLEQNRQAIDESIKQSFEAFEDNDIDGEVD